MSHSLAYPDDPEVQLVPLSRVVLPPDLAGVEVPPEDLERFRRALRISGGIQNPLLVRPIPAGDVELLAGLLRYHAALADGMESVPCRVRAMDDRAAAAAALLEQLAGKRESPLARSWRIEEALRRSGWTQRELAQLTPLSEGQVSEHLAFARAAPRALVREVAERAGVSEEGLAGVPRKSLRRLQKLPDESSRRAFLTREAGGAGDQTRPGNPTPGAGAGRLVLAGGVVVVDRARVAGLAPGPLLVLLGQVVWTLLQASLSTSPHFAGLRRAKQKAAKVLHPSPEVTRG
jgi:ParB/RepB/Spo0J family partition protein